MRKVAASLGISIAVLLGGCSTGTVPNTLSTAVIPAARGAQGIVHGGQQPVSGATVQLWAVGTTGYGSATTSLTSTTTASDGSFSITGTYTCPASNPQVYITATGGNPGLTAGTNNTAISLMAALLDCNSLQANAATTFITINEVTTVAAAYALAQFMNPSTGSIGSYGYSNTGLQNAFSTAINLANASTGTALATTPNGNGVVPQAELNTIANILAPCVNSNSNSSPQCSTLFGYLQGSPSNSLLAALSMALHPGTNVALLFGVAGGSPPFQPALSVAPNDWTVAMSFNNGATASAKGIAIDASGNAWSITGSSRLSKLSSQGAPLNGSPFSTNLNGPGALAIDTSGNVWVVNAGNGTLAGFANSGSSFAGPISGLNSPDAATFDRNGFLWIANYGNSSLTEFNPFTNSFISPSAGYTNGISSPAGIVADYLGNMWVANATSLTQLNPIGAPSSGSPYVGGGISTPYGIAIDGPGNVCGCLTIRRAARWRNSTAAGRRSLVAGIPAAAPAPRLRLPSMAAKMFGSR